MRLIDADAFLDWLDVGHLRNPGEVCFCEADVMHMIKSRQTVDAVPVVRCCDCKHCDIGTNYFESWCYCKAWRHSVNPTDFCSYGERKEEEK